MEKRIQKKKRPQRLLLKPQASLFVVAIALLLRLLMPCLRLHHRPSYVRFFPSNGLKHEAIDKLRLLHIKAHETSCPEGRLVSLPFVAVAAFNRFRARLNRW